MGNPTISVIALPGKTPDLDDDVVAAGFDGDVVVAGAGWPCYCFQRLHKHCCYHLPVDDPHRNPSKVSSTIRWACADPSAVQHHHRYARSVTCAACGCCWCYSNSCC